MDGSGVAAAVVGAGILGLRATFRIREIHPDIPVVLTATGMEPEWAELSGVHKVTPFVGQPTAANLSAAIEQAIAPDAPAAGEAAPAD